jgi:hydroxyethylthiazole kinase
MNLTRAEVAGLAGSLLDAVRAQRPLVHNITNYVAMDISANALLAIGASPAMVHAREEVVEFIGLSGALVVNIGTLSPAWVEAMQLAAEAASRLGKPWILDPVGVGATSLRNEAVAKLLPLRPSIIRGNASEIMAIAGSAGAVPKGVDSANTTQEALDFVVSLARHQGCTVVATGAVDIVTDGERIVKLANGSPLMTQVTALGCALSGVTGAFAAVTHDRFAAAVASVAVYGIVGEMAAGQAWAPGSFRVAFLDALQTVGTAEIDALLALAE